MLWAGLVFDTAPFLQPNALSLIGCRAVFFFCSLSIFIFCECAMSEIDMTCFYFKYEIAKS